MSVDRTEDSQVGLPDVITVDGFRYRRIDRVADRLGAHLMYDCHLFRRAKGANVREVVADWQSEHDSPQERYGAPMLCPITVLEGSKELRRVGAMVHPTYGSYDNGKQKAAIAAFIAACEADPDIPRLLAAGRNCNE